MNVGLYFGTFNPIHVGHLIIANHMVNYTNLDQIWLVVSPQNPLKKKKSILQDYHRLALVNVAIENTNKIKASDIEFSLPKPSYTSDTLVYIQEKYPEHQFSLIMGEDNLRTFHKWKNYQEIIQHHKIYVYPRAITSQEENEKITLKDNDFSKHKNVIICDAPVMKISSSFIRNAIKEKKEVNFMLTEPVYNYVTEMHFYEK